MDFEDIGKVAIFVVGGILAVRLFVVPGLFLLWMSVRRQPPVAQPGAPHIITAREWQTTTVLADGRVLIVGGKGPQRSAELYDPVAGEWSSAASLATGRYGHTATLLTDGRVLVAGGLDCRGGCIVHNALRSAEIHNPSSDTWTPAAPMRSSRWQQIAALLPDGRVLVSGGIGLDPGTSVPGEPFSNLASSEIYDPLRDTWTPAAPMHLARASHRTVLLPDGRVLVAGGGSYIDPRVPRQTAEVYDPTNDTWLLTAAASLREFEWVAALPDGTVLAMSDYLTRAQIYDPFLDQWGVPFRSTPLHSYPEPIMLPNGLVLASGGTRAGDRGRTAVADAALFDPRTGSWTPTGSMGFARGFGMQGSPSVTVFCNSHTPVLLRDGTVLVYGGRQAQNSQAPYPNAPRIVTSEVYDPASGTWSPRGS